MRPVGYLTAHESGFEGERGTHYSYVLAGNGVYVEAEGPLLGARVLLASAEVRGLAPLESKVVLRHGRIPAPLFDFAVSLAYENSHQEIYVGVRWTGSCYKLVVPKQSRHPGRVDYARAPSGLVLDLHSHHQMPPHFSSIDDEDETGFQLYGVVGNLPNACVALRVGVYGHFQQVRWSDVFEGALMMAEGRQE